MAHVLGLGPVPPNVRQYNMFQTIFCLFLAKKVQKILNLRNFEKKNIRNFDYFVYQVLSSRFISGSKFSLSIWNYF